MSWESTSKRPLRRFADEASGACGDLGTLLPFAVGAVTLGGMSGVAVFAAFGVALVGTGLFYALPIAVQPMKALGALVVSGTLTPAEVALAGVAIGIALLLAGVSGAIERLARVVPRSVSAGLQLGLGAMMIAIGIALVLETPLMGLAFLALVLAMLAHGRLPAALLLVLAGVAVGVWQGPAGGATVATDREWQLPLAEFVGADPWRVVMDGVLPQLALTITNAVVITAVVARELFPAASGSRASERNLCLTSGAANVVLAPFGALPMCHGAGGLQAQYRFGARSGLAPVLLGVALIVLSLAFAGDVVVVMSYLPVGVLGALLIVAGADLALSPRMFDARPDCRPAIAATALLTVAVNPAIGLLAGWSIEGLRGAIARRRVEG